jgi:hypothetical protein
LAATWLVGKGRRPAAAVGEGARTTRPGPTQCLVTLGGVAALELWLMRAAAGLPVVVLLVQSPAASSRLEP